MRTPSPIRFSVLGVILARGGSKGLPRKHLLPLLGQPLIAYTFSHVRQSRRITHAVISSDCPKIIQLATLHGFDVIDRPSELATDYASVQDVLLHALDHEEQRLRTRFDAVVTLYGNVAVRPVDLIDHAVGLLMTTGCDSVRSFASVGKFHPAWMSRIVEEQRVQPLQPGSVHRRQDLEALFHHDGGVVVTSRQIMDVARKHREDPHAFFGQDRRGVVVEPGDVVEVDSRRDLLLAEAAVREQFLGQAVAA